MRRYRPGLVAFAAAYAPLAQAEDVVQESLVSSWDALRRSTEEIRLKPWLYTIVRNRALNARRDTRPHGPLTDDLDGVRQPDEVALTNEELGRVVAAVGALPEAQREALVRSAIEGHTHEQIATALGFSPGAVRQLIYRGRLAVRSGVGLGDPAAARARARRHRRRRGGGDGGRRRGGRRRCRRRLRLDQGDGGRRCRHDRDRFRGGDQALGRPPRRGGLADAIEQRRARRLLDGRRRRAQRHPRPERRIGRQWAAAGERRRRARPR